jgi:hypothetical protein
MLQVQESRGAAGTIANRYLTLTSRRRTMTLIELLDRHPVGTVLVVCAVCLAAVLIVALCKGFEFT